MNDVPVFARHETFHPRYGWFKKCYDAVTCDEHIFTREDATVVLGVGKNMVQSIRYWGTAFKILEESSVTSRAQRSTGFGISEFGKNLLGENGWDPYLEDPASLWLLHWFLLKDPCKATVWKFTFNEFHRDSFTSEDIFHSLREHVESSYPKTTVKDSSLQKDINCVLRMYVDSFNHRQVKEDSIDCPFTDLSLIKQEGSAKRFSFNYGKKNNLPNDIILATCLDYIANAGHNAKTISLTNLLHDQNSPGMLFKLTESVLFEAVERGIGDDKRIVLSDSSGLVQLSFKEDPSILADNLIRDHYRD